jgi:hypothetical protein
MTKVEKKKVITPGGKKLVLIALYITQKVVL